jgi:NTP pyrophosphatase (non-canonical NTP hydrolase)
VSGHDLAREIVKKHGVDRYPTAELTLLKLAEEVGELIQAYLRDGADLEHIRKEYADVGLVLYGLGDDFDLNLDEEMKRVVDGETRRFA